MSLAFASCVRAASASSSLILSAILPVVSMGLAGAGKVYRSARTIAELDSSRIFYNFSASPRSRFCVPPRS
jgi:hypothetical protein